jgi:small conductance mechanosensitive channel
MNATEAANSLINWLQTHGIGIAVVAIGAFLIYRYARPLIHRLLLGIMRAQQATLGEDAATMDEYQKRAATLEDLFAKVLRTGVVLAVILIVFGVFDLWPVVAGLGIVLAAITLAGQSIVLDYLMGILILVEGQYFKGDTIKVGEVEGEVEEVGLRRTILRDSSGTVHSVSNGTIRLSSNLTRLYAVMRVEITVVRGADVERAIEVIDQVGREMAEDPEWKGRFLEAPSYQTVSALTEAGATIRVTGRVRPLDRWAAPGELRRRLVIALSRAGIETALHETLLAPAAPVAPKPTPAGSARP